MRGKLIIVGVIVAVALFLLLGVLKIGPTPAVLDELGKDLKTDGDLSNPLQDGISFLDNVVAQAFKQVGLGGILGDNPTQTQASQSAPSSTQTESFQTTSNPTQTRTSQSTNPTRTPESEISVEPSAVTQSFETLSLTATREGHDVIFHYEDSSGKTVSVTVKLRNSEKEIFSGEFHSSMFEVMVNDVSDTPHVIEMIVKHQDHGQVYSSAYLHAGDDSVINGIFAET